MLIHFSRPLPSVRQFIKLTSNAMRSSDARGVGSAMYGTNKQRGNNSTAPRTTFFDRKKKRAALGGIRTHDTAI